jgi:mannose-6-phosphate isomerase-like protein (cupin superfamily)
MARSERDPLDRLNAELDALADATPDRQREAARLLSPAEAALIGPYARLRQLDALQATDVALSRRIWEELMNKTASSGGQTYPFTFDVAPLDLNGHPAPQPWRALLPRPRSTQSPRNSPWTQTATALLLIAAVIAVFIVVRPHRPAVAPQQVAAPLFAAPGTLLFTTTVASEELPAKAPVRYVLAHGTVQPGAETHLRPSYAVCCPGTFIDYVLKGTYALRVAGPLRVIRANGEMETIPANTEVTLAAGDAAIHRFEDGWDSRNPGSSTTEVLDVLLVANDLPDPPSGLNIGDYSDVFPSITVPQGPLRVELRQAIVTPGSSVFPGPQPGDHQAVVAGQGGPSLGLMSDGSVQVLGQVQNLAPEPAIVYTLTLRPEAEAASQGDPPAVLLETTLGRIGHDGPLDLAFWRGAIAPGDAVSTPPDWAAHAGTEVELVLSGTLVVQANEPLRVMRSDSVGREPETAPAGEPVTLGPGDAVAIPFGSTTTLRNPGDESLELLGALVLMADEPVIASLSPAVGYLIRNGNLTGVIPAADAPSGPLTLTLSQLSGAEHAWPAQAILDDGAIEWRMLEFSPAGTPAPGGAATVFALTLSVAE